jgi:hypothetical protein
MAINTGAKRRQLSNLRHVFDEDTPILSAQWKAQSSLFNKTMIRSSERDPRPIRGGSRFESGENWCVEALMWIRALFRDRHANDFLSDDRLLAATCAADFAPRYFKVESPLSLLGEDLFHRLGRNGIAVPF